jgi:crotonobetainyl-CoA:carnitine CoA-transferase CaiB-like acyl-CoA transferase
MEHALNGREPEKLGNRDRQMCPHGCFRCEGEDAWVTIACADESEWRALCDVIDPTLARDSRFASAAERKANEDALDDRIIDWTRTRDRWEITRVLQAVGVAAFPSLSPEDLALDPHLKDRGFFAELEHAEVGTRTHAGIPWRLTNTPTGVRAPAPLLGADTSAVLRDLLGYSEEEIERLTAEKVLF